MKRAFFLALLLGVTTAPTNAEPEEPEDSIWVHNGFLTGDQYRDLTDFYNRAMYVSGVIDGMLLAPMFKADKASLTWLETCIEGMKSDQVAFIVDQYLQRRPQDWHHQMHGNVFRAFSNVCPQLPSFGKFN